VKGVMVMTDKNDWSTVVDEPPSNPGTPPDRHRANQQNTTVDKSPTSPTVQEAERVTVNLTPRSVRALRNIAEWTHYSKTDTINRALQVYEFIQQIIENDGSVHIRQTQGAELERLNIF
jgi:hypothetical protein